MSTENFGGDYFLGLEGEKGALAKGSIMPPRYYQIALDIASKIVSGSLKENTRITGRSLLSTTYAVSPETIRRSMRLLADMGIVEVKSNSGTTILSREKAVKYVEKFKTKQNARVLKKRLGELLSEREAVDKKIVTIINEIMNISEYLRDIDPLQNYELEIPEGSPLIGKTIEELKFWQNTGATIIAIKRGGQLILSPGPYASFGAGDIAVVSGDAGAVERVKDFIGE